MSSKVLLGTSIAPNSRLKIQKSALESWAENGFDIVSFNTPNEILTLSKNFPAISFIPIMRTGEKYAGKPLPLISDILQHLNLADQKYCGIVNSDIYFSSSSPLSDVIKKYAKNSFVYGPRFDVNDLKSQEGKYDPLGFDYFIFDKRITNKWDDNRFCLGMPFWDHWFPLIPILNGHTVKKIIAPIARHATHPNSWGTSTLAFNDEFIRILIDYQMRDIQTQNNKKLNEILVAFKEIEIQHPYYQIKAKLQEQPDQSLDNPKTYSYIEDLAKLFDRVTRDTLKFIENHSEIIKLKLNS